MTRQNARIAAGALILATILAGILVGCVHVALEPELPLPVRPKIKFFRQQGNVCMTEDEADQLGKFADELDAFKAARERLLKD
ncbi:MAG TPA: hypothetical protein VKA83_09305 [Methylomirabilota bacterium]|nr:hypothetical protein [Methylomirabilota bacterium]